MSLRQPFWISSIFVLLSIPLCCVAGPLSLGSFTQLKFEYQYTDYYKYKYPNPILFEYPGHQYSQPAPYIADFPENRALAKVTQSLGINDVIHVKYQYSDLDRDKFQDLFNIKYIRNISAATEGHASAQITRGSGSFLGKMFQVGGRVDWAGFFWMEGAYAYYSNRVDTAGASTTDAHSFDITLRQALTKSTAFQVRHNYFFASGARADFVSNTLTFWVSQFFPTKTALHLEWREHWDTTDYLSHSPAIEIDQYLSWSTVLVLRGRFYTGKPKDPNALAMLQGDHFESSSVSASITHHLFAETKVMFKYRYYWSDQDIQMNTYLISLEHIL